MSRETLSIDPQATEFQRDLVWLYARLGTNDAAQAQYVQYAQALRNDLGADPPSFAAVCAEAPRGPSSLR